MDGPPLPIRLSLPNIKKDPEIIFDDIDSIDRVIYHNKCPDGIAAAWPFWRQNNFRYKTGKMKIEGFSHGQPPPVHIKDEYIIIVDFCFSYQIIKEMSLKAKKIIIIDHHVSAKKELDKYDLPQNVTLIYDLYRSGAQLAWDYVYNSSSRPFFIDIIADRDLWRWQIKDSKEIGKALATKGFYSWENMEIMYHIWMLGQEGLFLNEMLFIGRLVCEQEEKEISIICSKAILSNFKCPNGNNYIVKIVSCPSNYRSEVGHRLCEGSVDFAVIWQYDFLLDEWWISCRGSEDKDLDLTEISSLFSRGGGHKNSAGFTIFGNRNEKLQTYFTPIEVPKNRSKDTELFKMKMTEN